MCVCVCECCGHDHGDQFSQCVSPGLRVVFASHNFTHVCLNVKIFGAPHVFLITHSPDGLATYRGYLTGDGGVEGKRDSSGYHIEVGNVKNMPLYIGIWCCHCIKLRAMHYSPDSSTCNGYFT